MDRTEGHLPGAEDPPHQGWSSASRLGCGCLITLLVLVAIALALFDQSISGWGVEAPPPAGTATAPYIRSD
jgi:hypothetical protein